MNNSLLSTSYIKPSEKKGCEQFYQRAIEMPNPPAIPFLVSNEE
jgi:hypothetical protein